MVHSLQLRLCVTCHDSLLTAILTAGLLGVLFGQSNPKPMPEPKFSELSQDEAARLEQKRAVVAAAAKQSGTASLTGTKSDLTVLQRLIDDKVFKKSQTYELQCLGVTFGDVLASEFPLRWMMVTDGGPDPALQENDTSNQRTHNDFEASRAGRARRCLGTSADDPRPACADWSDHALTPSRRNCESVVNVTRRGC